MSTLNSRLPGSATEWTGVDVPTPLLPDGVRGIETDQVTFEEPQTVIQACDFSFSASLSCQSGHLLSCWNCLQFFAPDLLPG